MTINFNPQTGPNGERRGHSSKMFKTQAEAEEYAESKYAPVPKVTNQFDIEQAKRELSVFTEKLKEMLAEARAFEITDEETKKQAVEMGLQARKVGKNITDMGAEKTKKHRGYTAGVRNVVKVHTNITDEIEDVLKDKFKKRSQLEEMDRREQEKKAQAAARELRAKINKEAAEKKIDPIDIPEPVLPQKQAPTRTEEGSGSMKQVWTFEILDWTKVERKHLEAIATVAMEMTPAKAEHHPVIRKVFMPMIISGGVRQIPGIRIFQDDVPVWRG